MNFTSLAYRRLTLGAIIAAAAALRLWGLDRNPLWSDELFSWHNARMPDIAAVIDAARLDVHPPGYFLMLHGIVRWLGDSEALLRLPSAVAAIVAVWAIYALGRRLYSEREALSAAAMLAFSWPGVYYAQNARAYAILLLAVILSFYFWVALARRLNAGEPVSASDVVGYALAALCAAYLHYFGLLVVFLQGVCMGALLCHRPRALLAPIAIYACLALAYAPWVPAMLQQMASNDDFWIKERTLFSAVRWQLFAAFYVPLWQIALLIIPALFLAALIIAREVRARRTVDWLSSDLVVIGWCVLPFLAAFIQSAVSTPVLTSRNLIVILPALYLLVARGMWSLTRPSLSTAWVGLALLAIAWPVKGYFAAIGNERYDLVAGHVARHDPAPIIAYTERQNFFDYYFTKAGVPHRVALRVRGLAELESVLAFTSSSDRFWLLSGPTKPAAELLARLSEGYVLADSAAYHGAEAWLFRRAMAAERP